MTDPTNLTPDTITTLQSGIVVKQLAIVVGALASLAYSLCSLFGIVITPDKLQQIEAALTALGVLGFAFWTIHSRITKPCPPINTKPKDTP